MKRTLQELLDYAEECLDLANVQIEYYGGFLQESIAASTLAHAVALASTVKYDAQPTSGPPNILGAR